MHLVSWNIVLCLASFTFNVAGMSNWGEETLILSDILLFGRILCGSIKNTKLELADEGMRSCIGHLAD